MTVRRLDMSKLKNRKRITISTEEALKDVTPYFTEEEIEKIIRANEVKK